MSSTSQSNNVSPMRTSNIVVSTTPSDIVVTTNILQPTMTAGVDVNDTTINHDESKNLVKY